jgi:hypothetical protein
MVRRSRRVTPLARVLALALPALAVAPVRAADPPRVVVTACVSGSVLTAVSSAGEGTGRVFAPRYRLSGRKSLVKDIKSAHAGHVDEFTGTITGDEGAASGRSVDLGKLSVRVGGAGPGSQPNAPRVPETPVFEVTSFQHTDATCDTR